MANTYYAYTKEDFRKAFEDLKRNKLAGNLLILPDGTMDTDYYNAYIIVVKYIRQEALKSLKAKIAAMKVPQLLQGFIMIHADAGYRSVETDFLLTKMECYPPELEQLKALEIQAPPVVL